MVLPAPRFRTTRKWQANNVQFDNAATAEGASTTTINLTTADAATIIVFVAGNVTNAARVDGVPMTLVSKTANAAMYYATGLAAGNHVVQTDRSGSSGHIVTALSYTGVTSVTGGALSSGTGTSLSGAPSGTGGWALVGFDFSSGSADIANATSNGSIRTRYRRTTGNCLAVADHVVSPVTLANSYGGSWTSIGVWLTT